ncbi:uncharacterized protein LOC113212430 [Frankliniella occidentalis]|uniref:Uncharacterized protein LOC113212430 n=1 Tax=Frankliniella occidentalis TaxID=133901 RepID=A0A9C6U8X6_FRAOC|nr:uncharacterized protein LOC113212430 [Frankliniella occidentalis]
MNNIVCFTYRFIKKNKKSQSSTSESDSSTNSTSTDDNKEDNNKNKKNKDDFEELNSYTKLTCRDLKLKRPYKLMDIKWSKEAGRNGPYKICTAKLEYKSKLFTVKIPTPIAKYEKKQRELLKSKIKKKKNPIFTVNKITQKKSPNFKGKYDFIESEWS